MCGLLFAWTTTNRTQVIKDDRLVYTREFQDSYYRPSTFVLAKLMAEIPATAVAAFSYGFLLYWTVGLTDGWETFLFFCLVFFCQMVRAQLSSLHSAPAGKLHVHVHVRTLSVRGECRVRVCQVLSMTLGLAIGAIFIGEAIPSVVLPVYITLNMLVCGFFVREETIPVIWHWLYDISFMQWVFSALCINQFQHQEYNDICEGAPVLPSAPTSSVLVRSARDKIHNTLRCVAWRGFQESSPAAIGYETPTTERAGRDSHLAQTDSTCRSQMPSPSTSQPTRWS